MSERPNFSSFHKQGESKVKGAIRNSSESYDLVGRESDPRVSEAMAYAAKPLIDNVLHTLNKGEPNPLAIMKDPKTGEKRLSAVPGVKVENYTRVTSYGELVKDVQSAHKAANEVQVGYYDKLDEAKRLQDEAKNSL